VSPHVLIGECTSHRVVDVCRRLGWGRMWVFRNIRPIDGEQWGFDNGAYKAWADGGKVPMTAHGFDGAAYMRRVERAERAGAPYLAVVPDLVAAGEESLHFSLHWRVHLPQEWPLYLAVQDGMTPALVGDAIDGFAGVFLGGTTKFKRTAAEWASWAHARGLRFHYARCSSQRAWRDACAVGADSVDSSQALWRKSMLNAWENTTAQMEMLQ